MIRHLSLRNRPLTLLSSAVVAGLSLSTNPLFADSEATPVPPSSGADVPVTYFGPAPSSVEPELIGPHQLITAGQVDLAAGTVKLPLYKGHMKDTGKTVWFILTDTSDEGQAAALGINYSAKLQYAATCRAARNGDFANDGSVVFEEGTVDFAPVHSVTPGALPKVFPPAAFQAVSVGDADYSPLASFFDKSWGPGEIELVK